MADAMHGPAPASRVAEITCPILDLFGGADPLIPTKPIAEWDAVLEAGGVSREIVICNGAPHSFFDRTYDERVDACNDAWRRA